MTIHRETVCPLAANDVEDDITLSIKEQLPSTKQEAVAKFNQDVKPHVADLEGVELNVVSTVSAGDKYQEITEIEKMNEEGKVSLPHDGKVWLVDFWATWCPPCQRPMAHNQEMLEKKGDDWKDKIRIIGLSIDQDKAKLKSHVDAKGWGKVEHFWRGGSKASEVYSVRGVPHVMLVDKNGMIVFKGHPANRPNLEDDLEKLAKGETITGEGCAPAGGAASGSDAEAKVPEGMKEDMDAVKINKEIDDFVVVAKEFQKDDKMKELAKGMPRCFCVMVYDQVYSPAHKKTYHKFDNYRVLVGP